MKSLKDLSKWYFSRKALPFWSILAIDCCLVAAVIIISFTINHGPSAYASNRISILSLLPAYLLCFIAGFRIFHTYAGVMRYSSFSDLVRVIYAVLLGGGLTLILQLGLNRTTLSFQYLFTIQDLILISVLSVLTLGALRIWVKTTFEETIRANIVKERAFILGIKTGGAALAKNIKSSINSPYIVAGFVAAETDFANRRLMGEHVYGFDEHLTKRMIEQAVTVLIVSPLMMDFIREHSDFIDQIAEAGIKIKVVPNAIEWDGKSDINAAELREVNVEDLLPRDKIDIELQAAAQLIENHVVLITGAAGSIGSEIVQQVASYRPAHLILIDQAETPMHDVRLMMHNNFPNVEVETIVSDIADQGMMERIFKLFKPEYVFHAAAYKHVPMMEDNPYESVINNVNGTKIIADLAVKYGARKFVMVSTDKAVNPTNIMGCSKRICEIYVQALDKSIKEGKIEGQTQFVTTRFGNVLGSNGSVIPIFQEQIRHGGPITVTHPNIIRYFMLIPEACKLVIEAGIMGKGGEIFVFDMGEPVKIVDLAKRMIKLSGAQNIEIKYTGLRDGEKLYEEVLNDSEVTLPTFHPKIHIAKVREYDYAEINSTITELIENVVTDDDMTIVARMKAIVPEFKSKHSKFEVLDQA